ncbi:WxL domain-containing protein [Enterococcus sp. AZ109]|uniref:WxL domain-containing protein n=1 Tax=Enterococcus sp. AZ109 TaxID=2774634 RepID=UPI003F256686
MKKILASTVVSVLLVANLGVNRGYAEMQSDSKTTGHVELVENFEFIDPRDPDDPTQPTTPEDDTNLPTGNVGPLSLDVAPKSFDFGEQKMYQTAHTYQGVQAEDSPDQYIQVTDNRDADVYGWVVTVRQENYLTSDGNILEGASIHIPAGEARCNLNPIPTEIDPTLTGESVEIALEEEKIFYPNVERAGKGTSILKWRSSEVALTIPAKQAKQGNYTNTILWTLTADVVY